MFTILADPRWYSYSTDVVQRRCKAETRQALERMANKLAAKVRDPINFFSYNGMEYMGFESRRIDYERDKANGTNHIEKLIAQGVYDRQSRVLRRRPCPF